MSFKLKQLSFGLSLLLGLISLSKAQSDLITCPILNCNARLDPSTCYQISFNGQITELKAQKCYDSDNMPIDSLPDVCPFLSKDGTYSWLDEKLQQQTNLNARGMPNDSQVKKKKSKAYCTNVGAYIQDLRPGRKCKSSYQCKSKMCNEAQCTGLEANQNCNSHDDCDNGMYCRVSINWPFESRCSTQRGQYESCADDYECQNSHFCWYASSTDRLNELKKCLPMYSQENNAKFGWKTISSNSTNGTNLTFTDFEHHGKYCKSGLAHQIDNTTARCTSATGVRYENRLLDDPYPCDPRYVDKYCQIQYDKQDLTPAQQTFINQGNRGYVEVTCKCSFGNVTQGFCGSVLGTDYYQRAVAALSKVMQSSKCHTLDRHDMRAQKDSCGIGTSNEEWRFAVEKMFNVTYWPYVQTSTVYECVFGFFGDSWYNLNLDNAKMIGINLVIVMLMIMIYSLLI